MGAKKILNEFSGRFSAREQIQNVIANLKLCVRKISELKHFFAGVMLHFIGAREVGIWQNHVIRVFISPIIH